MIAVSCIDIYWLSQPYTYVHISCSTQVDAYGFANLCISHKCDGLLPKRFWPAKHWQIGCFAQQTSYKIYWQNDCEPPNPSQFSNARVLCYNNPLLNNFCRIPQEMKILYHEQFSQSVFVYIMKT